jgi:hypothetical protein
MPLADPVISFPGSQSSGQSPDPSVHTFGLIKTASFSFQITTIFGVPATGSAFSSLNLPFL